MVLPKGSFAVAKMLDGVISQQESYDLEEVRVPTLASALPGYPHPEATLALNPHSSPPTFALTLQPRPRPCPFTLTLAPLRTAQVFDDIVEDYLRSGATVREFASVGWRSLLYKTRPTAGPPKQSRTSVT